MQMLNIKYLKIVIKRMQKMIEGTFKKNVKL